MQWLEVSIDTTPGALDAVCARLIAEGFDCLETEDEGEFLAFMEENRKHWDYVDEQLLRDKRGKCRLKLYLPADPAARDTVNQIEGAMQALRRDCPELPLGTLSVSVLSRQEEEWENAWKKYYKPLPVGDRLFIRPVWETETCPPGRTEYISDPGMAFGTGTHASTRLCLLLLEKLVRGGEQMLDLGCGSGILSICALLLGADRALGVDIDPNAARVALENARLNGVLPRFSSLCGDVLSKPELVGQKYDIVAANIVADVIMALGSAVPDMLEDGGTFIVSGIIEPRLNEVRECLAACGFAVRELLVSEGWCAMTLQKGGAL